MNESKLNCGRPPECIGVQIPLELVEAECACSNKLISHKCNLKVESVRKRDYYELLVPLLMAVLMLNCTREKMKMDHLITVPEDN